MKHLGIVSVFIIGIILILIFSRNSNFLQQTIKNQNPQQNNQTINTSNGNKVSEGENPSIPLKLPGGFTVHVFASGLSNPRDLVISPGGTILVSVPLKNQVVALPDKDQNGVSDEAKVIITGENHVHGLAFYNGQLFIADVDKVVRYNFDENTLIATKDKVLFSLPQNNDHNNRTITFDSTGKMYVSVGSTCNVCNENSNLSATIIISDANGTTPTVFAKGLRNAPFIQFNPTTNDLWGTEMGRDNLGDNVPPDEINIIKLGNNYGWPNCYGNKIHDTNFDKSKNDPCGNTTAPIYEIPAHSAPLGLTFINSNQFPPDWQGDLLVSYHGSWNRSTPIGYKVVHLKVNGNSIAGSEDFLTGFLPPSIVNGPEGSLGRPVDLTFDKLGSLYLSDDKAGNVYIIQKSE